MKILKWFKKLFRISKPKEFIADYFGCSRCKYKSLVPLKTYQYIEPNGPNDLKAVLYTEALCDNCMVSCWAVEVG